MGERDYITLAEKLCEYGYTKLGWKPWSEEDAKTYVTALENILDEEEKLTPRQRAFLDALNAAKEQPK